MPYLNSQTRILSFRGQSVYSNLPYELAGKVIEQLSGEDSFAFIQHRIFAPLKMTRTSLQTPSAQIENVAKCYNVFDDGSTVEIPSVKAGDDWFFGSGAGMRSCLRDLQKLYHAFMVCSNDQLATKKTSTPGFPLRQVTKLMAPHITIDPLDPETSYALGWTITQTPCKLGYIGPNPNIMTKDKGIPIIGKGAPSALIIYHQGSLPGALALTMLLPETMTSIVILSNSLALNDVPDWFGQMLLEEILNISASERNGILSLAIATRRRNLEWHPSLLHELKSRRKHDTSPREFSRYEGTFWNTAHLFKIVVTHEKSDNDDDKRALLGASGPGSGEISIIAFPW
jgi:CubicO group peptidase (beta-lactamase class C family)